MRRSILTSAVVTALLPALLLSATAASAETPVPAVAARAKAKKKPAKRPAARRRSAARRRTSARRRAPAPPEERIPRDPPKPGVVYSVSGTITVTGVVRTQCAGLGGRGTITETATTTTEHSFSGSGSPGGRIGSLKTKMRRRAVLDKEVVDVEYVKPGRAEGPWTESGGNSTTFGDVVFLSKGQLFVDLRPAIGERRRSGTVRPAPGDSAPVRFSGDPVRTELPDSELGEGCLYGWSSVQVSGTVTVSNKG